MKYKVALFIGRFQPFHNGHWYSLKKCFELADRVVVGIGSSQESGTENNPWDYEVREKMVNAVLRGDSSQVVPLPDTPSDDDWLRDVVKRVGLFDVVVSNNEWVLSIMKNAGYKIYETGLYNRDELEGVKIRTMMRAGDEGWKLRVPDSVCQLIGESANQLVRLSDGREFV